MKKSLLIILSLIFMNMTAFAVGVDCWEEYSRYFNPNTKSVMQDVLGDSATITRIKTEIHAATFTNDTDTGRRFSSARFPLVKYVTATKNSTTYYLRFAEISNSTSDNDIYQLYNRHYYANLEDTETQYQFHYLGNRDYDYAHFYTTYGFMLYVHTFCLVSDHSSSGGGGGAAGASVNYIIKAD